MKNASKLIFIFLLGTLASCTVPTDVELANGTSDVIVVTYSKGAGEKIESKIEGKSKGEIRTLLERGGFSITFREKNLRYESLGVPEEYVEMSFRSRTSKAQFAPDNCIYLIHPRNDSLATAVSRDQQPEGYPLCPR